jgi:hypothetical protein
MPTTLYRILAFSSISAALFPSGCFMDDSKPKTSTDTKELLKTVELSLPIKSA